MLVHLDVLVHEPAHQQMAEGDAPDLMEGGGRPQLGWNGEMVLAALSLGQRARKGESGASANHGSRIHGSSGGAHLVVV